MQKLWRFGVVAAAIIGMTCTATAPAMAAPIAAAPTSSATVSGATGSGTMAISATAASGAATGDTAATDGYPSSGMAPAAAQVTDAPAAPTDEIPEPPAAPTSIDPGPYMARTLTSAPKDPAWLTHFNLYREASGLAPVTNNPAWDAAIKKHAEYLVRSDRSYTTDAHSEVPGTKYYSAEGNDAARTSNIIQSSVKKSGVAAIDGWLSAPYHAFAMLLPSLEKVAYADYYSTGKAASWVTWAGGLNVIKGLRTPSGHDPRTVLFPGAGMTTDMPNFSGNESPDPLAECPSGWRGLNDTVGLPLIVINNARFDSQLRAAVTRSNGTVVGDSAQGTLCVVSDQRSNDYAIFLITKKAYTNGYYTARVEQPGKPAIEWAFGVNTKKKPRLGCSGFPDVAASDKFCKHITWFANQKITKPANNVYGATDDVNRGSMVTFLFRMLNPGKAQPKCTSNPFPDVPKTHRFCGYIKWAADNGIAQGYSDGKYRPENSVTRGAMAAFLYRIAGPAGAAKKCAVKPFKDVAATDTFCGVITWMKNEKLTSGVGNGTNYGIKDSVTRGQMAAFLYRL